MHWKKVYIDVECTYAGSIDPEKDRDGFFKDFQNWKFYIEKEHNGKKVIYKGIIGIFILELEFDEKIHTYKIINKKFIQLIGKGATKENLMKYIDGANEIIGYHCRTMPDHRGYVGYDFPIINSQLGIMLDGLPGISCTDLELDCHKAGMYGGLKKIEEKIPSIPQRTSGVADGLAEEKLLLDIAVCEDEEKREAMWKRARQYNKEDVMNLIFIEHYLRNLKIIE